MYKLLKRIRGRGYSGARKRLKKIKKRWHNWFHSFCDSLQGFLHSNFDILVPEAINERVQHGYHIGGKHCEKLSLIHKPRRW